MHSVGIVDSHLAGGMATTPVGPLDPTGVARGNVEQIESLLIPRQ
jgi:hypothetical protein